MKERVLKRFSAALLVGLLTLLALTAVAVCLSRPAYGESTTFPVGGFTTFRVQCDEKVCTISRADYDAMLAQVQDLKHRIYVYTYHKEYDDQSDYRKREANKAPRLS